MPDEDDFRSMLMALRPVISEGEETYIGHIYNLIERHVTDPSLVGDGRRSRALLDDAKRVFEAAGGAASASSRRVAQTSWSPLMPNKSSLCTRTRSMGSSTAPERLTDSIRGTLCCITSRAGSKPLSADRRSTPHLDAARATRLAAVLLEAEIAEFSVPGSTSTRHFTDFFPAMRLSAPPIAMASPASGAA